MKKFRFRLQRVLDIKHTIEEARRRDFLAAQNEHDKAVAKLNDVKRNRSKYIDMLYTREQDEINVLEINMYYRYFQMLEHQIARQFELIKLACEEVEKRRVILVEAVKDRRIIERLKEKKFSSYMKETLSDEQFISDDLAGGKFFQQKNNPVNISIQGVS